MNNTLTFYATHINRPGFNTRLFVLYSEPSQPYFDSFQETTFSSRLEANHQNAVSIVRGNLYRLKYPTL